MKWDQIENKWAAMTRRVRADWSTDTSQSKATPLRRAARDSVTPGIAADQHAGTVVDTRHKMSIE